MGLVLKNISLPLAPFTLEVDAEIQGRVTSIFGPSGAGKTSLLDLVAGLRRAKSAFIQLDDQVLFDSSKGISVPTRLRGIGYVPQDLALFPHLSVRQNLLFGRKKTSSPQISYERVVQVLEIESLIERAVTDLSGGEKQRVALARALLASPRLLLLDEPLASLDLKLKARILPYLARVRDEFKIPMLYVTHDRYETLTLADQMLVLVDGKVVQAGPVAEVFSRPASLAVARLLTIETVQAARVVKIDDDLVTVEAGGTLLTAAAENFPRNAKEAFVCIRAEDVILIKGQDSPSSARNHLAGVVESIRPEGPLMRVELSCGFTLSALLTKSACADMALRAGDRVVALVKAPNVHLIPR